MDRRNYLIVGQGIAGSVLAWQLMKAGNAVVIVDNNHHESSSIVSAGIINPITGQRLALTPQFDIFVSHAMKFYEELGAELDTHFFIPKPIIRVLRSPDELARAHHLRTTEADAHIAGIHASGHYGPSIDDPFGTLTIANGGYLQTALLLKKLKTYFIEKGMFINEHLSYNDVRPSPEHVRWKSKTFDAVIFCEGFKANRNPWFNDLPYNFAKGEMVKLVFESSSLPDAILCQQQWCLPTPDGTYLAGATYDRDHINTTSTAEGQNTILRGINDFIRFKAKVIEGYAAVRPVMLNQKPAVRMHPSLPRLGIFNGFASKGILWTPYYAEQFAKQLNSF